MSVWLLYLTGDKTPRATREIAYASNQRCYPLSVHLVFQHLPQLCHHACTRSVPQVAAVPGHQHRLKIQRFNKALFHKDDYSLRLLFLDCAICGKWHAGSQRSCLQIFLFASGCVSNLCSPFSAFSRRKCMFF